MPDLTGISCAPAAVRFALTAAAPADRWRTLDGWPVQVVRLTCTPDRHDDTWLRVRFCGYWPLELVKLARWFAITELGEALAPRAAVTYLA